MRPLADGHTHINIYSRGRTELGRFLSNFTEHEYNHYNYGKFASIEAFWHWRHLYGSEAPEEELDRLRVLSGNMALVQGRALRQKYEAHLRAYEYFEIDICNAIGQKILDVPRMRRKLCRSSLPFKHYYWYGDNIHAAKTRDGGCAWMVKHIEVIRMGLWLESGRG